MGSPSEWCKWPSNRQCFSRSDPTDSSHSETRAWTDAGRGLGWTGSTKSLRNEAYGRLEGLGSGCCRVVCTSCPISCGRAWATLVIPCPPALVSRLQHQAVARPSVSIGLSSRATDRSLSRRVASSGPARVSRLRRDLRSLEAAFGGFAEALYLMS